LRPDVAHSTATHRYWRLVIAPAWGSDTMAADEKCDGKAKDQYIIKAGWRFGVKGNDLPTARVAYWRPQNDSLWSLRIALMCPLRLASVFPATDYKDGFDFGCMSQADTFGEQKSEPTSNP